MRSSSNQRGAEVFRSERAHPKEIGATCCTTQLVKVAQLQITSVCFGQNDAKPLAAKKPWQEVEPSCHIQMS